MLNLKKPIIKNFKVVSDARIALEGAFSGRPGSILISGTGSIMFGKDSKGEIHRVGGFGRFIGDEGSGYSIGKKGLAAVSKFYDGRGNLTMLSKLAANHFKINDSEKLINAVYKNNFDIAQVAEQVIYAAKKDDEVCKKIVDEETDELIFHITAMKEKLKQEIMEIAFIGSIITNDNYFSQMLNKKIKERFKDVIVKEAEHQPVMGAVFIAKEIANKMKRNETYFKILFLFPFLLSTDYSQNNSYNFSGVEKVVTDAIKDSAFPGAVVLVSKDGEIQFQKAFGNFTYDKNSTEVTTKTIYDLASLTKVIATTTAAMICYDRNLFSLDDKVCKYIPEFSSNNKENITIKNLLLHNTGLPAWKKFWGVYDKPEDVLNDIYDSKLEYETGTKTVYSDLGIIVLGKIIEKVTGQTLDIFCKEEIFEPLGMNDTYYNPPDTLKYRIAPTEVDSYWRKRLIVGEVHDETASLLNGVSGHAGLFSTAEDIHKVLLTSA